LEILFSSAKIEIQKLGFIQRFLRCFVKDPIISGLEKLGNMRADAIIQLSKKQSEINESHSKQIRELQQLLDKRKKGGKNKP
jgi:hypothetical protein